jgi:endonuclease/exonuclease/phosphatase family metal-dependent hydrolase
MHSPPVARTCPSLYSHDAVSWYTPADGGEAPELDRWCSGAGPVVIDSIPERGFGSVPAGDSLAVVVWNTAAGSGDLLGLIADVLGYDCDGEAAPAGSPHFVLFLQEAYRRSAAVPPTPEDAIVPPTVAERERSTPRLDVVQVARRCGLALAYVPSTRNGPEEHEGEREDKGNAILSTLPLSDFIAIEVPLVAQRRVSVGATLHEPAGDSLRIVSVHINTIPGPWRTLWTGATSRLRQALSIADALRQVEIQRADPEEREALAACYPYCDGTERPHYLISTLAGGDLNTASGGETALLHLWERFPDSPPFHGEVTSYGFPTDHVLFRRGPTAGSTRHRIAEGSYRRLDSKYSSDHYPLVAWLKLGS